MDNKNCSYCKRTVVMHTTEGVYVGPSFKCYTCDKCTVHCTCKKKQSKKKQKRTHVNTSKKC